MRYTPISKFMAHRTIETGVVHTVPQDLQKQLVSDVETLALWNNLTPLARNKWICWIESAKNPHRNAH
jgi:uncharacterized protein YdeI (YjbR/CyaY-like superfamily)